MNIKKIYFDMDNTLADFTKGANKQGIDITGKMTKELDKKLWKMIKNVDHFYKNLEPIEGAVNMFNDAYERFDRQVEILTGLPKPERKLTQAVGDKIDWCRKHLKGEPIINLCHKDIKNEYCKGKGYVLIDDLEDNCTAWRDAGGTAIQFISVKDTISKLSKLTYKKKLVHHF